jgi:hypothetical protein
MWSLHLVSSSPANPGALGYDLDRTYAITCPSNSHAGALASADGGDDLIIVAERPPNDSLSTGCDN